MRHYRKKRKFGRKANVRRGFIRSLAIALIENERIVTTEARAKELRPYIEKLVTKAKRGELADRRLIAARLGNQATLASKLVDEIAPRYRERNGGYTRIIKLPQRAGDASPIALIEFLA